MVKKTVSAYARRQYKRFGKWTKKRYGTWRKPNLVNVVRDVKLIKSLVNVEKKYAYTNFENTVFGLTNGASRADYSIGIIGLANGTGESDRIGNSIKLTSMQYSFTISKQTNVSEAISYNMYIVQRIGSPLGTSTGYGSSIVDMFIDADSQGNYSTRSLRSMEHFGTYRVLRKCSGMLYADASSTSGLIRHDCKGYVKLNTHVRWGTDDNVSMNQFYLICLANDGDIGTGSAFSFSGEIRYFYVDN